MICMSQEPIVVEETYPVPPSRIWKALTDLAEMKLWYFDLTAFEARPGFRFEFAGQGTKGEKYIHHCEVKTAEPPKKLSYSWQYENTPGYSQVTFDLNPDGNGTRVRVTHAGTESFGEAGPDFARESFTAGWTSILRESLKKHLAAHP